MSTRILIFAKAPEPGRVKTRLIPALGALGAANLAREMLEHTLTAARDAACGPVELCMSPAPNDAAWSTTTLPESIACSEQGTGDLGARMARAAQRALAHNERVILIGTDCVELSASLLRDAAAGLDSADAFMHPTADGGYALLALQRFSSSLFADIHWSTPTVAHVTRQRIHALGWKLREGAVLHDVDEAADLARWLARTEAGAYKE